MATASGRSLGLQLLDIFNLDPRHVRSVSVTASVDAAVLVTIEQFASDVQAGQVKEILTRYELTPKGSQEIEKEGDHGEI